MSHRRPVLALLAALLGAPGPALASGDLAVMDDARPLLDLVDRLVGSRPLTAAGTGRLVGATLAPVGELSTERKLVYAAAAPGFTRVELRLPGPRSTHAGQFLLLDVAGPDCVTLAQVEARHGQGEPSVPTPRQPPDAPLYLKYLHDWGSLSFGFARVGPQCVKTVAIDFAPPK